MSEAARERGILATPQPPRRCRVAVNKMKVDCTQTGGAQHIYYTQLARVYISCPAATKAVQSVALNEMKVDCTQTGGAQHIYYTQLARV